MFTRPFLVGALAVATIALAAVPAQAQKISVRAATPNQGAQATSDLEVLLDGSGFGPGAQARFVLSGTDNPDGIAVKATRFVSSTRLAVTIDIAETATLASFDIKVTLSGRTGKGTDLFQVVQKSASCQPVPTPQFGMPVSSLNAGPRYTNGFGHRLQAATVTRPDGSTVLVLFVPNRQERAWVFVLDPVTLVQVQAPQMVVLPTQPGAVGPFFPQYGTVMGDFDANGVPDFAMANTNPGTVYVVTGRFDAGGHLAYSTPALISTPSGGATVTFGAGLGAGDLDGVPGDELLVVQGYARLKGVTYPNRFYVYRFSGSAAAPVWTAWRTVTPVLTPAIGTDTVGGFGVAIGDVDGDGDGDIVAGSGARPVNGLTDAGEVFMFEGPAMADTPTRVLRSAFPANDERFGARLALTRSLLSDAVTATPALLVSGGAASPFTNGYEGPFIDGAPAPDAVLTPAPQLSKGWAYHALVGGDINDDGILDVGVSASGAQASTSCQSMGTAHLFLSRTEAGSVVWDKVALQPPGLNGGNDPGNFSTGLAFVEGYGLVIVGDTGAAVNGIVDAGQVYIYRVNAQ
jgi:hypothetical protein